MSQLRDGSRGRLSSHDGGIPVYSRAVRKPDFFRGGEASAFMPNHSPTNSKVRADFLLGSPGPSLAMCKRYRVQGIIWMFPSLPLYRSSKISSLILPCQCISDTTSRYQSINLRFPWSIQLYNILFGCYSSHMVEITVIISTSSIHQGNSEPRTCQFNSIKIKHFTSSGTARVRATYTSNQSKNCGVKYERISVAPARTILSVVSNAITRKSYTPARAPATIIANSPLTWYAASG